MSEGHPNHVNASIILVTVNRADELRRTLESLGSVRPVGRTELLVVDNNSTDHTKRVVDELRSALPFDVRYFFVPNPGKYGALNAAIGRARGEIIVATDDDARFEPDWLEQAVAGLDRFQCDFVGGRVVPAWCGPRPRWLPERNGLHDKVIAVLDHGDQPREFGVGISWPLGVNVAYRRQVFDSVGLFDNSLGRTAGTLRNQAQREWHLRARADGLKGMYLPDMVVHHLVTADRLTKRYFRRWFYWHGISRAILFRQGGFDIEEPDALVPPNPALPQLFGVPTYLMRKAAIALRGYLWHSLRGDSIAAFEWELGLWFFAGVVRQRVVDRHLPSANLGAAAPRRSQQLAEIDHFSFVDVTSGDPRAFASAANLRRSPHRDPDLQ
jgi:glycosyltransferase involved in cell wall biosynthesis